MGQETAAATLDTDVRSWQKRTFLVAGFFVIGEFVPAS
jgi:hypothetical protein